MTIYSLPEPELQPEPPAPRGPWSVMDLIVFAVFFALTVLLLPAGAIRLWRVFNPSFQLEDLSGVYLVLLQGFMNIVLVAFIAFLIKVVHRQSFRATMHWFPDNVYSKPYLIALGATLAISVLLVSSFFPPSEPPPIEKILTSTSAMYVFALFGIGVAPILEELMFRGFLFKVLHDLGGTRVAVTLTALLFALLHVPQLLGSWAGIALILVVGYVLSLVRMRSNSLIPSFIIHTAYNTMLFGVFALSTLVQKGVAN